MPSGSRVSWQHLRLRGVRGRRLLARRCHALDGLHFLPTFAQVHLILQARQRPGIAVGVELIIKLENHSKRILGVRKRLQMPRALS